MTTEPNFTASANSAVQSSVRSSGPRAIVTAALVAAIPIDLLLNRADGLGVNTPLIAAVIAGALVHTTPRDDERRRVRLLLGLVLVALASILAVRGPSLLWLAVMAASVGTLGLMILPDAIRGWRSEPLGVPFRGIAALAQSATGPMRLFGPDVDWRREPRVPGRLVHARGLAWSIPVLLPFIVLFAAADPVFAAATEALVDVETIVTHVLIWGLFAWLGIGWLTAGELPFRLSAVTRAPLGARETIWVLGALALLFDVFVALQFRWFFGGDALPLSVGGLTYAEYARRGFFELVTVGALLLGVLLLADWVTRDAERSERRQVRLLSALLLGLLAVVLTSALMRMRLYIDVYGLTQLRFFTTAFMFWLVVVFIWFAATILRERRQSFMAGVYASGITAVFLMASIDPVARIARFNLQHRAETGRYDAPHAATLGPDAVPTLIAGLDQLEPSERCEQVNVLRTEHVRGEIGDWRAWNLSQERSERLMRANAARFDAMCGPHTDAVSR